MNGPIMGEHTAQLMTGGKTYNLRDWDAIELAESLPDVQRWTIKLSNGTDIDSERYRVGRSEMKR